MRTSFFKTAAVALFGLASVVTAAPTAVAEPENRAVSNKVARAKVVPDVTSLGYKIAEGLTVFKKTTYTVTRDGVGGTLDQIVVDPLPNRVIIQNAANADDTGANKVYLSDMAMYLFTNKGKKQPSDLKKVRFEVIVESGTQPAIKDAYAKLGKSGDDSFTVKSSDDGAEKEVFDSLSATTFGKVAARYHDEYETGAISEIKIEGGTLQPTMEISLDD